MLSFLSLSNFNSIKVRLNHDVFSTTDNYDGFQFHKGTIKPLSTNRSEAFSDISIP